MDTYAERYNLKSAAAWLRGHTLKTGVPEIDVELLEMPLEVLTDEELSSIVEIGERTGQKLYPFKTGKAELPRVRQVLGFLHGIEFNTLLDVGSGRGVFLLPFMEEFPQVQVTSLDLLDKRVTFLNELALTFPKDDERSYKLIQSSICVATLNNTLNRIDRKLDEIINQSDITI